MVFLQQVSDMHPAIHDSLIFQRVWASLITVKRPPLLSLHLHFLPFEWPIFFTISYISFILNIPLLLFLPNDPQHRWVRLQWYEQLYSPYLQVPHRWRFQSRYFDIFWWWRCCLQHTRDSELGKYSSVTDNLYYLSIFHANYSTALKHINNYSCPLIMILVHNRSLT